MSGWKKAGDLSVLRLPDDGSANALVTWLRFESKTANAVEFCALSSASERQTWWRPHTDAELSAVRSIHLPHTICSVTTGS
jgi:hypothetical protein